MKTWEQILIDNPPFRPDSSTDGEKMHFMFLLEDGRLIGDAEGRNHCVLMGWTSEDGDHSQAEQQLCERNKALRVCYQPFSEKRDGTRGDFWAVYVQIDKVLPNDAQWATLSNLYALAYELELHQGPMPERGDLRHDSAVRHQPAPPADRFRRSLKFFKLIEAQRGLYLDVENGRFIDPKDIAAP